MTETMTTLLIILSEVVAILLAIVVIFLIVKIRLNRRHQSEAKKLVKKIKQNQSGHKEKLHDILKNKYDLQESQADETINKLIEQENSLLSKIINLYLGNSETNLNSIDDDVKNLTRGISEMVVTEGGVKTVSESQDVSAFKEKITNLESELEKVRNEKEKLQTELNDTLQNMEGMMTEYASMYAGGVKEGDIQLRDEMKKLKDREWNDDNDETENNTDTSNKKISNVTDDINLNEHVPDLDILKNPDKPDKK